MPAPLRAAFLTLLVLGLVIRPTLIMMCELHRATHSQALDLDDHRQEDTQDQRLAHQPEDLHAHGSHGLLHEGIPGGVADVVARFELPLVFQNAIPVPDMLATPTSRRHAAGPFRPPIG